MYAANLYRYVTSLSIDRNILCFQRQEKELCGKLLFWRKRAVTGKCSYCIRKYQKTVLISNKQKLSNRKKHGYLFYENSFNLRTCAFIADCRKNRASWSTNDIFVAIIMLLN